MMKHLQLTFAGLLALTAATSDAFTFGLPGPPMGGPPMGGPPMGGGLPRPPMGGGFGGAPGPIGGSFNRGPSGNLA